MGSCEKCLGLKENIHVTRVADETKILSRKRFILTVFGNVEHSLQIRDQDNVRFVSQAFSCDVVSQ